MEKGTENTRVTLIGIIVEDPEAAIRINGLLHEYGEYIIGRMGIPYRQRGISIISVVTVSYTHLTLPTKLEV